MKVKSQIVYAGNGQRQDLLGLDQVAEIGFAVKVAGGAVNTAVNGRKIPFPFFVIDIDDAIAGK